MKNRNRLSVLCLLICVSLGAVSTLRAADDEPALPEGVGDEPTLPEGVDNGEPALPEGVDTGEPPLPDEGTGKPESKPKTLDLIPGVTGFWEVRGGVRTQKDPYEKDASIGETRLQLSIEKPWQNLTFKVTADFLYDAVVSHHSIDLETGQGWLDLREAYVSLSPLNFMDMKIGRQICTWGTGDLIFINDMFPKDWQAFFIGRDEDYLKAPSDAIKTSLFSDLANVDVVYTPVFDADRYITGERLSYYSSTLGRRAGRDAVVDADVPNKWFRDSEWATRIYKNIAGYELAAYGYWGFWKSPGGQDPVTSNATFPRLNVYGGSVRGQVGPGIANFEAGYYDSHDDREGTDPYINNSELRLLGGYEQDLPQIARDLTVGVQYYVERMMDYDAYMSNLPAGSKARDQCRQVVTFRITKLLMNQNLKLSFFAYYSPTDCDTYIRPNISYKIDDHWTAEIGANVFVGKYINTFFGQFDRDTNVYMGLRYGF